MDFNMEKELLPGLPAYAGGRMAGKVYDAGRGLHATFNDGLPYMQTEPVNMSRHLLEMHRLALMGCQITLKDQNQRLEAEIVGKNRAFHIEKNGNDLRVTPRKLRADVQDDAPCLERAVVDTDRAAFDAYIALLEQQGFSRIWENQIENNIFRELQQGQRLIYAAFMGNSGVARFVDDTVSAPITALSGGTATGKKTELCQFGLYYDRMTSGVTADCGMLYMLRLPDNSLFVVDGGEYEQSTDAAAAEVMRLMQAWTGTQENEKIRIAGWFCTHAHDDHLDMFAKLLRLHHDAIDLQRIIFNFPAYQHYQLMPSAFVALQRMTEYYPNALYLKPHAGQEFTLAGVKLQFLQTHEDSIREKGDELIGGFNDASTVLKISFDGVSFLLLGDIDVDAEKILLENYSARTLHVTAVQTAHHLINLLPRAYDVIAAEEALIPANVSKADPNNPKYMNLLRSVPREHMHFAFDGTTIWTEEAGRLVCRETLPVVGGRFDGSLL